MKFCSVGTLKRNLDMQGIYGARSYYFDDNVSIPKNESDYMQSITSARCLGQLAGKTTPVAGIKDGNRYLMALSSYNFTLDSNGVSEYKFVVATRSARDMMLQFGVFSREISTLGYKPSVSTVPRINRNTVAAKSNSDSTLEYNSGRTLLLFVPDIPIGVSLYFNIDATSSHTYDATVSSGSNTYTYYTQYSAQAIFNIGSGYTMSSFNNGIDKTISAGNSNVKIGDVNIKNSIHIFQPWYSYFRTGGAWSNSALGVYRKGNGFTSNGTPFVKTSAEDETINISFSAMGIINEFGTFDLVILQKGVDFTTSDPVPNLPMDITLLNLLPVHNSTINC